MSLMPLQSMPSPDSFAPAAISDFSETRSTVGSIVINEVMYDPLGTELDGEWVELHNPGSESIDVTGWTISDQEGGVDFTFPAIDFPPNGFALVRVGSGQNSTAFINGTAEFFMWKTTTLLSNNGDDVLLSNSTGATVDFMSYGQWGGSSIQPPPADFTYSHDNATAQEGFSLARLDAAFRYSVPTPAHPNGNDAAPRIILTEVHYNAWGENEFFTIHNPLAQSIDISCWYLTDLEGKVAFPMGMAIPSLGNITVAQNASNFMLHTLNRPDFEYSDSGMDVQAMTDIGTPPSLANSGDELFLLNNFGSHIDAFVYGASAYSGPGWPSTATSAVSQGQVAKRNRPFQDTNSSADWDNIRQFVVGQSDFSPETFQVSGPMTLFASPDSSYGAVVSEINNATQSIWLTVYEFTSSHLAQSLISAIGRGVDVRIFLEGAPVSGITADELFLARKVVEAGGEVRMMTNDQANGMYARYTFVHAKYAVMDSDTLMIMSENWGQSGIPVTGSAGNRGWGAIVRDAGVAGYFADVFLEDWNPDRTDSMAFDSYHPLWSAGSNSTYSASSYVPMFPSKIITSTSTVIPVLSPDTSLSTDTILGMLDAATERLLVQEFYIYKHWGGRSAGSVETTPNLYLESVIDAARRGCQVRILLDATYYNAMEDDPIDNDDTVAYVNGIAAAESLDMEAKLVNLDEHGFDKIHNKGLVADDSVLISSINWNLNSVTANRESGIIIKNKEAADYFAAIFEHDWIDDLTPPFAHFRADDSYRVNAAVTLNATTSSDNAGIVNYTWSIDGQPVCYDLYFNNVFTILGQYSVNLTVRDAWGNAASYQRTLNITENAPIDSGDDNPADPGTLGGDRTFNIVMAILILVPLFIFMAILLVPKLRRR
jgi:phosphatidylserine/phosphatidylglycerophosphate/cardiolipin synthase-like enzyme